jgi:hypothetical protein
MSVEPDTIQDCGLTRYDSEANLKYACIIKRYLWLLDYRSEWSTVHSVVAKCYIFNIIHKALRPLHRQQDGHA